MSDHSTPEGTTDPQPAGGPGGTGSSGSSDASGYQQLRPKSSGVRELIAPVAGFGVTFASMFRPTVTEQYPFEKVPTKPRYHGRHQLNRYADGLEKCIGCELCAWACPADAIYVEGASNAACEPVSAQLTA